MPQNREYPKRTRSAALDKTMPGKGQSTEEKLKGLGPKRSGGAVPSNMGRTSSKPIRNEKRSS